MYPPSPLWKRKPDPVRTPLASKHYEQPRGKCGATLPSSLPIFKIFYRNHAARTAEIAAGELSPTVADAPASHRVRFAVAVGGVGGGVSDSCYPCSGHYSNTYQPRPRWCTDTPRRSCTRCLDKSRRLLPHFGTRRTAMPRRRRLRGSTASSEAVPDHLAPQPPGRAIGTRSPVVPCKPKMTVSYEWRNAGRDDTRRFKATNVCKLNATRTDGEIIFSKKRKRRKLAFVMWTERYVSNVTRILTI